MCKEQLLKVCEQIIYSWSIFNKEKKYQTSFLLLMKTYKFINIIIILSREMWNKAIVEYRHFDPFTGAKRSAFGFRQEDSLSASAKRTTLSLPTKGRPIRFRWNGGFSLSAKMAIHSRENGYFKLSFFPAFFLNTQVAITLYQNSGPAVPRQVRS